MTRVLITGALICLTCILVLPSSGFADDAEAGGGAGVALAQGGSSGFSMNFGAAFGAGIVLLGAGLGIGRIGSAAVEGMSRQPEVAGNIQTAMIISAALIEGATFFALIVCMLFNN